MARKIAPPRLVADKRREWKASGPIQMLSVLDEHGSLLPGSSLPMSDAEALAALRLMILSRSIDDRAIKLNRGGKIGIYSPVHGQEATVVGSCWALDPSRD